MGTKSSNQSTEYWCLATNCLGGDELISRDENENLWLYPSKEEAMREAAIFLVMGLDQFIDYEREMEDTDFECQDYAVKVTIENGYIVPDPEHNIKPDEIQTPDGSIGTIEHLSIHQVDKTQISYRKILKELIEYLGPDWKNDPVVKAAKKSLKGKR